MRPCRAEDRVVQMIRRRGVVGRAKYATSMDREDFTTSQWIQHFQEELADGLQYAERMKGEFDKLEKENAKLRRLYGEACDKADNLERGIIELKASKDPETTRQSFNRLVAMLD